MAKFYKENNLLHVSKTCLMVEDKNQVENILTLDDSLTKCLCYQRSLESKYVPNNVSYLLTHFEEKFANDDFNYVEFFKVYFSLKVSDLKNVKNELKAFDAFFEKIKKGTKLPARKEYFTAYAVAFSNFEKAEEPVLSFRDKHEVKSTRSWVADTIINTVFDQDYASCFKPIVDKDADVLQRISSTFKKLTETRASYTFWEVPSLTVGDVLNLVELFKEEALSSDNLLSQFDKDKDFIQGPGGALKNFSQYKFFADTLKNSVEFYETLTKEKSYLLSVDFSSEFFINTNSEIDFAGDPRLLSVEEVNFFIRVLLSNELIGEGSNFVVKLPESQYRYLLGLLAKEPDFNAPVMALGQWVPNWVKVIETATKLQAGPYFSYDDYVNATIIESTP